LAVKIDKEMLEVLSKTNTEMGEQVDIKILTQILELVVNNPSMAIESFARTG